LDNNKISSLKRTYKKSIVLSEREWDVIEQAGTGKLNKDIAEALHISAETVKKHLKNIYRKLEVSNKIEALNKVGRLKN